MIINKNILFYWCVVMENISFLKFECKNHGGTNEYNDPFLSRIGFRLMSFGWVQILAA